MSKEMREKKLMILFGFSVDILSLLLLLFLLSCVAPLISRVSYLRNYSRNGLKCIGLVSQEASSRERVARKSRNSLCKNRKN